MFAALILGPVEKECVVGWGGKVFLEGNLLAICNPLSFCVAIGNTLLTRSYSTGNNWEKLSRSTSPYEIV